MARQEVAADASKSDAQYVDHGQYDQANDDLRDALKTARKSYRLARRSLLVTRVIRRSNASDLSGSEPWCSELAAACAQTFAMTYCAQMLVGGEPAAQAVGSRLKHRRIRQALRLVERVRSFSLKRWRRDKGLRRARALLGFARAFSLRDTDVRFRFGLHALGRKRFRLAEREIEAARRGDPTRPVFASGLALARARQLGQSSKPAQARAVREPCEQALREMAHDYFPARDGDAWKLLEYAYAALEGCGASSVREYEKGRQREKHRPPESCQIRAVAAGIEARLRGEAKSADEPERGKTPDAVTPEDSESSLSSLALWELENTSTLAGSLGLYSEAMRRARSKLQKGQRKISFGQKARTTERLAGLAEFQAALRQAERATSLNPLSASAWETLGDVYRELFDFANARTAWTHALTREPDNPDLYGKIGVSYWYLAYGGYERAGTDDLERAAEYFHSALLLYGNARFQEQLKTHYRLGKLYVAQGDFSSARSHLGIVEAAAARPPLVGWQMLALAHLARREFSECEHLCKKIIESAGALAKGSDGDDEPLSDTAIVGDRVDERAWPLGLIRGWGHLAHALSQVERDADLVQAMMSVRKARKLAGSLAAHDEFPSRLAAACADCEGLIRLKRDRTRGAIKKFETAIAKHPYSRSYLNLALARERQTLLNGLAGFRVRQFARRAVGQRTSFERERRTLYLERLIGHATDLGPTAGPSPEGEKILARIDSAPSGPVSPTHAQTDGAKRS